MQTVMLFASPLLPQELWDKITAQLLPWPALDAALAFKFKSNDHDKVLTAVFKSEDRLESDARKKQI
jgi:hypothetical protein